MLESFYGRPGAEIASALGRLISSPGVEISEVTVHLDGLNRYKGIRARFIDCIIAATDRGEQRSNLQFWPRLSEVR